MGAERYVAAPAQALEQGALRLHLPRRGRVVERRDRGQNRGVIVPALERDGPLAGGRDERGGVQHLGRLARPAQALQRR
jgi:hypothetical protein